MTCENEILKRYFTFLSLFQMNGCCFWLNRIKFCIYHCELGSFPCIIKLVSFSLNTLCDFFFVKSLKYFIFKIFELAYIHLFVKFRKGNNVLNLLKMCRHLLYLKFILCAKLERKLNLAWPCIFFLNQVENENQKCDLRKSQSVCL